MPAHDDARIPDLKFGTGQSVSRKEDPKLVTGRGRFTDDVDMPGQAYAHPLRSHNAHGVIRDLDVNQALAAPGVLAVYTAADTDPSTPTSTNTDTVWLVARDQRGGVAWRSVEITIN